MPIKDPIARAEYERKWRENNRQLVESLRGKWRAENPDYGKTYYLQNKERILARSSARFQKNKTAIIAKQKARRLSNPEAYRERLRTYNAQHRDRDNPRRRRSYHKNKENWKAARKEWVAKNRHKTREYRARRRALLAGCTTQEVRVIAEWRKRWMSVERVRCYWCLKLFDPKECAAEHIISIYKCGPNRIDNLCVSCYPCNLSKHTKGITEWNKFLVQPVLNF